METPGKITAETRGAGQRFLTNHPSLVKFDSENPLLISEEQPASGWWSARRLAARISDVNPFRGGVVVYAVLAGAVVFGLLVWLGRYLFFLDFGGAAAIPAIFPDRLASADRNIVLLHLAGDSLSRVRTAQGVAELRGVSPAQLSQSRRWLSGGTIPVLFTDFDLSCAGPKTAAAWLEILEYCAVLGNRRVVLVTAVDPARFIREAVQGTAGIAFEAREFFIATEARWKRVFLCFDYQYWLWISPTRSGATEPMPSPGGSMPPVPMPRAPSFTNWLQRRGAIPVTRMFSLHSSSVDRWKSGPCQGSLRASPN